MLIKRKNAMTPKATGVKKFSVSLLGTLALCTTALAPNAYASDSLLVDKTVTTTIKLSELQSEGGTQKVYAKLKKRASSFCIHDRHTLSYLKQSVAECTNDLVEQFIQSADIAELKAYHLSENTTALPRTYALNTK